MLLRQIILNRCGRPLAGSSRGASLVEMLISVVVIGIGAAIVATTSTRQKNFARFLENRQQLDALRNRLMQIVDCSLTLGEFQDINGNIASCPSPLVLLDTTNSPVFAGTGNAGSGWVISAQCDLTNKTVEIRAFKNKATGSGVVSDAILGPLNSRNSKFNPIIGNGSAYRLCAEMFGARPRVASFDLPIASTAAFIAQGLSANDCQDMNNSSGVDMTTPKIFYGDAACLGYCTSLSYTAGIITNCDGTNGNATCDCIR